MAKKSPQALEEISELDLVDLLDFEDYEEILVDPSPKTSKKPRATRTSKSKTSLQSTSPSSAYAQSLAVAQAYNLRETKASSTHVLSTQVDYGAETESITAYNSYSQSNDVRGASYEVSSRLPEPASSTAEVGEARKGAKPQSVSSLLAELNAELNHSNVYVEAEIASIAVRNNHAYLTLRDLNTQDHIPAHIGDFSQKVASLQKTTGCTLDDYQQGKKIEVFGQLNIYTKTGKLQIEVQRMRIMDGIGAMLRRLEEVKQRIISEGLDQFKQPIPSFPMSVGVISSMQAAGLKDFLAKFKQLAPDIEIFVYESFVQGDWAPASLVKAIERANLERRVDLLIVTRGGGAFEDLLPFSDYRVVKAVAMSELPIISAIGHKIDNPLVDLVSDLACITPTDAAETVCLPRVKLSHELQSRRQWLQDYMRNYLLAHRNFLENNYKTLTYLKDDRLSKLALHLQTLRVALQKQSPQAMLENRRHKLLVVKQNLQLSAQRYLALLQQKLQQEQRNLTTSLHYMQQLKQSYLNKLANLKVGIKHAVEQSILGRKNHLGLLENRFAYLKTNLAHSLSNDKARLAKLEQELANNFQLSLTSKQQLLMQNQLEFKRQFQLQLQQRLELVNNLTTEFFNLDPTLPLKRGFALVQNQQGELVSEVNQLIPGDYKLIFQDGSVDFVVSQTNLKASEKSSLDFNAKIEEFKKQVAELRKLVQ